jgi:transcription antitermination factor NusG
MVDVDEFSPAARQSGALTPGTTSEPPQYALQVRYRYERQVEQSLRVRGFAPFLPVFKSRRRWSDRITEIETPLFPGYVFCSMDLGNRMPVLSTPGVVGIVAAGKQPLPVDPYELEAVRAMIVRGIDVQPCFATPGQKVRIGTGPLKGIEGSLLQVRGKNRLVVRISILNRSISAIIDGSEAVPL